MQKRREGVQGSDDARLGLRSGPPRRSHREIRERRHQGADVWGQARLTKYREEFEAQMQLDLNQFQERLREARTGRITHFSRRPSPYRPRPAGRAPSPGSRREPQRQAGYRKPHANRPSAAADRRGPRRRRQRAGAGRRRRDAAGPHQPASIREPIALPAFPGTAPGLVTALASSATGRPHGGNAAAASAWNRPSSWNKRLDI